MALQFSGTHQVAEVSLPATAYTRIYDYDGSGNMIYEGWAQSIINPATSQSVWAIRKYTYNVSNYLTNVQWAAGSTSESNIWDNRASLSYQ